MSTQQISAARLKVEGRVQGVGFRYFVFKNARRNGLKGWVRNLKDGSVEAYFEGATDAIETVVELCKKGPAGSSVKNFDLNWSDPELTWQDFDFKYE
jgi:acylphosphatase